MKRILSHILLCGMLIGTASAHADSQTTITGLALKGEIQGENIVFTLSFDVDPDTRGATVPLVTGDIAYLDGTLPRGSTLQRNGNQYSLLLSSSRSQSVTFRFASRAIKDGDWRQTSFVIPSSNIRRLSVLCDRDDLEIRFPGALSVERGKDESEQTLVTAFLGITDAFEVQWKPEVKKLAAELVVACDANTIAAASVGALRIDSIFTYRVIQGNLSRLTLSLPDVNVTQVNGEDIQGWHIDRSDPKAPQLIVDLSRTKNDRYRLQVESEMVLPKFPCAFTLPVFNPTDVIRTSGFLMIGTDSAIRLQIEKAGGLTQVDQAAFPAVTLGTSQTEVRSRPQRSTYAYQYANTPYRLELNADDIVTSYSADNLLVLKLQDNELAFDAAVQIDIKDAPAREIMIETDANAEWTITGISGPLVSEADTDVREEGRKRIIYVPFKSAAVGTTLINIRMERSLKLDTTQFTAPRFSVRDARTERGYLVVAAEKGVRLKTSKTDNLREVHIGSAPMRVTGAQQAFRFKTPDWSVTMDVERTEPSMHSEVFHLVSLGEGVMYASAAVTYHIGGAPVQEFKLRVPETIETVEFTGADIEGWTRNADICTVRLQTRIMGHYTLLATYDRQFAYEGAVIEVGSIETVATESEVGYIAIASSSSLKLTEADTLPASIIEIDDDEIPTAYSSPVTDPIIGSYKYVRAPHVAKIRVEPFATEQLLSQIADYVHLSTELSKNGEAVTTATYYIKNATRQYLIVSLPDDVDLWSIKYVDANGQKSDAPSQQSESGYLVPVQRPLDPNIAILIEVVYAQSMGELGAWNGPMDDIQFIAPQPVGTHSTFASWAISIPDDLIIAGSGGNMVRSNPTDRQYTLLSIPRLAGALCLAILDGPGHRRVVPTFRRDWYGPSNEEFTRTVNLAETAPLALSISVVPRWIGAPASPVTMALLTLLGIACVVIGRRRTRNPLLIALGITAICLGFCEFALGRSILAAVLAVAVFFWIIRFLFTTGWRLIFRFLRFAVRTCGQCICATGRGIRKGWTAFRAARERAQTRKLELTLARNTEYTSPPPLPEPDQDEDENENGYTRVGLLLAILVSAATLAIAGPVAQEMAALPVQDLPVADSLTIAIEGPPSSSDTELSASVKTTIKLTLADARTFAVALPNTVLKNYSFSSDNLTLDSGPTGYTVTASRKGTYEIVLEQQVPVRENNGRWSLDVFMLPSMKNEVTINIPEGGLEIEAPAAVLFHTEQLETETTARAVFGPVTTAMLSWKPRVRTTVLEEALYFCEVNCYAALQSGLVDLTNLIRYQIAQGEVREMRFRIPSNMSVTAVQAKDLATWSFDPETQLLVAILERGATGALDVHVVTQVSCEGLPYTAQLGVLEVLGAARQRGSIAIAAPDTLQLKVGETTSANPINIEDFSPEAISAARQHGGRRTHDLTVRKAFRYHSAEEASITIESDRVLPEIRVTEAATVDISDERIVLSTGLQLTVTKSGIFSVDLEIPADFDVETLTGRDVSHWDDSKDNDRRVTVHFNRRVTDATSINLVVARTEKGIEKSIAVPRVKVVDARKHHGRLTVSGERGVRLMVADHRGVDIKKASEEGIRQVGVLVFDILRPNWEISLSTEVMAPLVKPDVLQTVDLTEGMLQCRAYIRYKIENAGIKTFTLQSPVAGVAVAVTGRNISRVHEIDKEKGLWQVDLRNKVENGFSMVASYQIPYDPATQKVVVEPLRCIGTDAQRGYLAVTCAGRVQVKPTGSLAGLKVDDPRSVPSEFGAGDLSSAILCYRTIREDYTLDLSVVRHRSADVLPASIDLVTMTSVVSPNRRTLTRVQMTMTVGDLRFLKLTMPHEDDHLWTALVNGREVSISRDEEYYAIPLDEQDGNDKTTVDMIYSGAASSGRFSREQKYIAPRFKSLPMNDITWTLYVVPGLRYGRFGGTMDHVEDPSYVQEIFDATDYDNWNKVQREEALDNAMAQLGESERLLREGKRNRAKQALQQAVNFSQGQADLNEDARVQFRNVVKEQVKLGLVNRREALRSSKNIWDESQSTGAPTSQQAIQNGDFSNEYAAQVEQSLSAKENTALEVVADKIIDQQAAAARVVSQINVAMPIHGEALTFERNLQRDPDSELSVTFAASSGRLGKLLRVLWPAALLFIIAWVVTYVRATRD